MTQAGGSHHDRAGCVPKRSTCFAWMRIDTQWPDGRVGRPGGALHVASRYSRAV